LESLFAGTIAGLASITFCHPFDVIRTQMQIGKTSVSSLFKEQPLRNLYRGFVTPFIAQGIYKSVIFFSNTVSMKYLFSNERSIHSIFLSGTMAGSINSFFVAPVEIIRTTQIIQQTKVNHTYNWMQSFQVVLSHRHGWRSLWKALGPTIIRDGPGVGLYFVTFDQTKRICKENNMFSLQKSEIGLKVFAGSMSGIVFWTWAMPVDTIKTTIESTINHQSIVPSWSTIFRRSFQALPLAYLRGIPSSAITLTVYDLLIETLTTPISTET
jgi:solute carrier family 25 (mitochondrial carnitine/acylcarnitine transporter), member 20/29